MEFSPAFALLAKFTIGLPPTRDIVIKSVTGGSDFNILVGGEGDHVEELRGRMVEEVHLRTSGAFVAEASS